jgi:hypothetical protein
MPMMVGTVIHNADQHTLLPVSMQEIRRRMDLLEKNFLVETRQLRGKLLSSDRENIFYKEKCNKLEDSLRVRIAFSNQFPML